MCVWAYLHEKKKKKKHGRGMNRQTFPQSPHKQGKMTSSTNPRKRSTQQISSECTIKPGLSTSVINLCGQRKDFTLSIMHSTEVMQYPDVLHFIYMSCKRSPILLQLHPINPCHGFQENSKVYQSTVGSSLCVKSAIIDQKYYRVGEGWGENTEKWRGGNSSLHCSCNTSL